MCDYSLYTVPNRLARDGEQLVVRRFHTGSLGLASIGDVEREECARREASKGTLWQRVKRYFQESLDSVPVPAVCIPPGSQLILKGIPGYTQQTYGLRKEEGAIFVQTSAEGNTYRDALRFYNGAQIRLQDLKVGQLVEVLSLSGALEEPEARELQMR